MKTVVWGNYKGGVGKTISTFQVAAHFAKKGKKVLLIDLDPQCSLSHICCNSNGDKTLDKFSSDETFNYILELYSRYINSKNDFDYVLLRGGNLLLLNEMLCECDLYVPLRKPEFNNNLFFIPSSISFENCRINELAQRMNNNIFNLFLMSLFIEDVRASKDFDYIFFDCPPTTNLLIQSLFLASDFYIVPTIIDEVSANGVNDYITEIEKTRTKYSMNNDIGSVMIDKVFGSKSKFVGVFETIYKERRGDADNRSEIIKLDKNIGLINNLSSLISKKEHNKLRYTKSDDGFKTENIFKDYIGHKDNRSGGESIPLATGKGEITPAYNPISTAIMTVLEG